jgi:hypothetical protein
MKRIVTCKNEERRDRKLNEEKPKRYGLYCIAGLIFFVIVSGSDLYPTAARQSYLASPTPASQNAFHISLDRSSTKVPFDLYRNGILVQARINNSEPIWLALDTGASINILNQRIFDRLALTSKGNINLGGGGGTARGQLAENVTISLAGVEVFKQPIASIALDGLSQEGRDVEGLIGTPFLMNFVVEVDYEQRMLTFHDPKSYSLAKNPDAIPMEGRDGWPFIEAEVSINGSDTATDKFMLDTGSNRIFHINRPFAEAHKILEVLPKANMAEGTGEGIGGRVKFIEARVHSIRIGKYTLKRPVVSISQDTEGIGAGPTAGVVGGDLLRRFTLILDYSSSRMLLKPNRSFAEPFEVDMSGLELETKQDDFHVIMIKSVLKGYPGAYAGLREGDEIVSLNGSPARKFNLDVLTKMFKQNGKVYRLTIRRNGKLLTLRMKTKRAV